MKFETAQCLEGREEYQNVKAEATFAPASSNVFSGSYWQQPQTDITPCTMVVHCLFHWPPAWLQAVGHFVCASVLFQIGPALTLVQLLSISQASTISKVLLVVGVMAKRRVVAVGASCTLAMPLRKRLPSTTEGWLLGSAWLLKEIGVATEAPLEFNW